jgi:hypothetical protein
VRYTFDVSKCDKLFDVLVKGGLIRLTQGDERLVPNLLRGRGRLISRDLDVGEEGSEQTIITLQSLHHSSVDYQHTRTRVGPTKKAYPY